MSTMTMMKKISPIVPPRNVVRQSSPRCLGAMAPRFRLSRPSRRTAYSAEGA